MAFDAAERNKEFGRIQCQRSKESSSRGKRSAVRVKVKGKVVPTNFLKIVGMEQFIGAEERSKGDNWLNCVVIRTQVLKHLLSTREEGARRY